MKTVYLVRHGEAEINPSAENKPAYYKGALADLTPRGYVQAETIAGRVQNVTVDTIIASTMTRAQQTAQVISKRLKKPFESTDLFTERRNPTSFIGLPWDDPETQRLDREWTSTFTTRGIRMLDGENFDDISGRASSALDFLSSKREENILVVTHGIFLRCLLGRMLFKETFAPEHLAAFVDGFKTANCGLTLAHYGDTSKADGGWYISTWSDHAHLG